eukprot:TRINITY_DN5166_c0_g1_i1.p1 TRINITY_DN5166_c0_g1~~TRINITY_DN5166_c0_g1_i1.p1  ORF type:complete len:117 (+),score=14.67 TRINITY_DN5166_c0_g1_i1:277-627(+)
MKSLRGKFKNIIWPNHGNSEVTLHESVDESINIARSCTLPTRLPSYHAKMTKQGWINKGVNQLCHVLENVEYRQKDIGRELEEQENYFQCLDHNIDHIEHKIHTPNRNTCTDKKKK